MRSLRISLLVLVVLALILSVHAASSPAARRTRTLKRVVNGLSQMRTQQSTTIPVVDVDVTAPDTPTPGDGVDVIVDNSPDAPTVEAPSTDVDAPDISAPDVNAPDVNAPDVDAPDVTVPNPNVDVDAPDVTAPDVTVPTPDVTAPDVTVPTPDVTAPDVTVPTPDVTVPDVTVPTPDVGAVDTPDVDINVPDVNPPPVNIDAPDVNIDTGASTDNTDNNGNGVPDRDEQTTVVVSSAPTTGAMGAFVWITLLAAAVARLQL